MADGFDGFNQAVCDYCGEIADTEVSECNWLSCTYAHCEGGLYHQDCLEKYFKSSKLEKNRKTGFKCPRGCGKGSKYDPQCPGRIDKSHPIHPRNAEKRRQAQLAPDPAPPKPPKHPPAAAPTANGKAAAKHKEEHKQDAGKEQKKEQTAAATPSKPPAKAQQAAAITKPAPTPVVAQRTAPAAAPVVHTREQLAQLKAQARREMGLGPVGASAAAFKDVASTSQAPLKPPPPPPPAWNKAASVQAEVIAAPPQAPTLALHPTLQQLINKKAKAPAAAGLVSMAPPPPPPPLQNAQQSPPMHAHVAPAIKAEQLPPLPTASDAPTNAAKPAGNAANALPVGMEYAETAQAAEDTKLTKAQKKNIKRAKKKKAAAAMLAMEASSEFTSLASETASVASEEEQELPQNGPAMLSPRLQKQRHSPSQQVGAANGDAFLASGAEHDAAALDTIVTALVQAKALSHVQQLQRLSFEPWRAAAAFLQHGCDLEGGTAWLLENMDAAAEEVLSCTAGRNWVAPEVDISEELQQLLELQSAMQLPTELLQRAVHDASGDFQRATSLTVSYAWRYRNAQHAVQPLWNGFQHAARAEHSAAAAAAAGSSAWELGLELQQPSEPFSSGSAGLGTHGAIAPRARATSRLGTWLKETTDSAATDSAISTVSLGTWLELRTSNTGNPPLSNGFYMLHEHGSTAWSSGSGLAGGNFGLSSGDVPEAALYAAAAVASEHEAALQPDDTDFNSLIALMCR